MPAESVLTTASEPAKDADLFSSYRLVENAFDETYAAPKTARPHWSYILGALKTLGAEELERRALEAHRVFRDNGVTYNVYSDSGGSQRPWPFDPIPALLTSREWNSIEIGLNQRAEVLDLLLADLYGPRKVLRRIVPPELILRHPGYLRPCHGMLDTPHRRLLLGATDLARDSSGRMCVLGDRTQAPSGVGYALENRIVLSRVLPSLYRDSHVHRLAPFFRSLRTTLNQLAPDDNPRVVMLTPGPGNETFFEHAYVAKYLGFSLVQGGDLTVRDRRVFLKTLDGLQPVHVILRRLDDWYCDPLELKNDSLLGTPGLVEAARSGRVIIANPLGSGILENAGLMAFLPTIAKELLGEDLAIPSAPTWWCGCPKSLSHVLAHLDRMVVKPIVPHPSHRTVVGARMSASQRESLIARMKARPSDYVGQEYIPPSTTPTLSAQRLEPRPMVLRTFFVARGDSYVVMPGGLTRVAPTSDGAIISNQSGGISKDTWVLASEPENPVTLLAQDEGPVSLSRAGGEVSSRLADNLFWLGRYAERTDGCVRLVRQLLVLALDSELEISDQALPVFLFATAQQMDKPLPSGVKDRVDVDWLSDQLILDMILDPHRPGSLRYNIDALCGAGHSARDRLSDDTWRVISTLREQLGQPETLSDTLERLEQVVIVLSAFAGLCAESMSRSQGWRFLDMGRRLERALFTIRLLEAFCIEDVEPVGRLWELLLKTTDSVMTYRRRYSGRIQLGAVLDLLLHDEGNPRSIGFQMVRLQDEVSALPGKGANPRRSPEEKLLLEAVTALRLTDMDSLTETKGIGGARPGLRRLLARLDSLLTAFSEAVGHSYFDHVTTPRQLVNVQ